jgi:hypothetical protein
MNPRLGEDTPELGKETRRRPMRARRQQSGWDPAAAAAGDRGGGMDVDGDSDGEKQR